MTLTLEALAESGSASLRSTDVTGGLCSSFSFSWSPSWSLPGSSGQMVVCESTASTIRTDILAEDLQGTVLEAAEEALDSSLSGCAAFCS